MPFDPAPIQPAVEVGPYQHFADAMLRGCLLSPPRRDVLIDEEGATCALGSILIGMGQNPKEVLDMYQSAEVGTVWGEMDAEVSAMMQAYVAQYGDGIAQDNDSGRFTREEIAARVAALR